MWRVLFASFSLCLLCAVIFHPFFLHPLPLRATTETARPGGSPRFCRRALPSSSPSRSLSLWASGGHRSGRGQSPFADGLPPLAPAPAGRWPVRRAGGSVAAVLAAGGHAGGASARLNGRSLPSVPVRPDLGAPPPLRGGAERGGRRCRQLPRIGAAARPERGAAWGCRRVRAQRKAATGLKRSWGLPPGRGTRGHRHCWRLLCGGPAVAIGGRRVMAPLQMWGRAPQVGHRLPCVYRHREHLPPHSAHTPPCPAPPGSGVLAPATGTRSSWRWGRRGAHSFILDQPAAVQPPPPPTQ